jgi:Restriction endonuclease fold toxin 7
VAEARRALNTATLRIHGSRGKASEGRVLKEMELERNKTKVFSHGKSSVPDALTDKTSVEIKDRAYVSLTRQLRIQLDDAQRSGRECILVTGEHTAISKPAVAALDNIVRRPDLGPKK